MFPLSEVQKFCKLMFIRGFVNFNKTQFMQFSSYLTVLTWFSEENHVKGT